MPLKGPPDANGEVCACRAPDRDGGPRTAGLLPNQGRQLDAKHLADLLGDGGEYRLRGFALCDERGHASQRGLLLGQLTQPRLIERVTAHLAIRGARAWRVHKSDSNTRRMAGSNVSSPADPGRLCPG